MKVATDVCVGFDGVDILRRAGYQVVVTAEHGEPDREWFTRAIVAGAEVIIAMDTDLEILAYDANKAFFRQRQGESGEHAAVRFLRTYNRRMEVRA